MSMLTQDTSHPRVERNLRCVVRTTCIATNFLLAAGVPILHVSRVQAADGSDDTASAPAEERFAIHGQMTYTVQATDGFNEPYSGPNSLSPSRNDETVDATLFLGAKLWRGAEFWIDPEIGGLQHRPGTRVDIRDTCPRTVLTSVFPGQPS